MVAVKTGPDLTVGELHDLLRLRTEIFVVEQECPYQEVDGRDLLATTTHLWVQGEDGPVACLRLLGDDGQHQIGRVATAGSARGRGLASLLVAQTLARLDNVGDSNRQEMPVVLAAQTYLVDFYRSHGFDVDGPEFIEDGIPHTPMRRIRQPHAGHTT